MIRHYLVLGVKVLLRRKVFTLISLFGVTLTLTVLLVATAFLDHLVGPQGPETRQDRMLGVYSVRMWGRGSQFQSGGGYELFDRYARDLPGVERLSIYAEPETTQTFVAGQKVELARKRTDAAFFDILEFVFIEGRPYSEDETARAVPVAVLSRRAREKLFAGAPAVGRTVELDGLRFHVLGVVENVSELRLVPFADIWVPTTTTPGDAYRHGLMGRFQAIVLARDRNSLPGIREEFNNRVSRAELPDGMERMLAPFETKFEWTARMLPLGARDDPSSQAPKLALLLGVVGLLFTLLPTVNLVNLNVSRIMERASEIGVRKAFGARSSTLVVQFIVENVLLALAGGVAALVVSVFVLRAINHSGVLTELNLTVNLRVFAIGLAMAVVFGVLSGAYPAWRMSRLRPAEALKGASR